MMLPSVKEEDEDDDDAKMSETKCYTFFERCVRRHAAGQRA